MQIVSFNGVQERDVLSSVIWDVIVLAATESSYLQSPLLFNSDLSNYVLKWVIDYYRTYKRAPGDDVKQIPAELIGQSDKLAHELTEFIETLSRPTSTNSARLIDIAAKHYEDVQVRRLIDTLTAKLSRPGGTEACIADIMRFTRISTGVTKGVNPINDEGALMAAFADNTNTSLLNFESDDARYFFGDTFSRSSFVVINASEKAGKSTLLLDFALRAIRQGLKVAYFEAGDMSQAQVFRRIYQRLAEHPRRAGTVRIPRTFSVIDDDYGKDTEIEIEFDEKTFREDMSADIALAACKKWQIDLTSTGINWKFSAHPQDLTVPAIQAILDEWERSENFIPDFVIVDYADILVTSAKNSEFRHQINDTFSRLRGISLERKCCLITATQASAGAYEGNVMTRQFLSEDKRKAAHPTAIFGLNATQNERENQVAKLNYLVRRDDVCNEYDCLYLAQSLAICNPMVKTFFPAMHRRYGKTHVANASNTSGLKSTVADDPYAFLGPGSKEFDDIDTHLSEYSAENRKRKR